MRCSQCNKDKDLLEFFPRKDSIRQPCRECHKCNKNNGLGSGWRKYTTHCPQGHEYTAENTYTDKLGHRYCRICGISNSKNTRVRLKLEVFQHYSDKRIPACVCCGTTYIHHLTIDHINNEGADHRRELKLKSGYKTYLFLKREEFPPGYQVLCFNCNMAKYIEGECKCKSQPIDT